MIKLQVIGNIGKDAAVNTVNGKNVINFTIAHSEKYRNNTGELTEKTTWVDCAYWTDKPAISQYLVKGAKVYAEGQPEAKSFQRSDGTPGSTLSVRVSKIEIVKFAEDKEAATTGDDQKDDLPF